jgi:hypothetical protein
VGEERRIQGFVGKPEGKRPLGRPRRRWKATIRMDLQCAYVCVCVCVLSNIAYYMACQCNIFVNGMSEV